MNSKFIIATGAIIVLGGAAFFVINGKEEPIYPTLLDNLPKSSFAVEQTMPEDLSAWVAQTPLSNPWRPQEDASRGQIVFTNEDDIFPFLGGWETDFPHLMDDDFLDNVHLTFKDPEYGESIAMAAILKEPQEVFLGSNYSSFVNPVFSGVDIMNPQRVSARLSGIGINFDNGTQKESILWVSRSPAPEDMMLLFNQNGGLVYAVAIGCNRAEVPPCLEKIKDIRQELGLSGLADADIAAENVDFQGSDNSSALVKSSAVYVYLDPRPDDPMKRFSGAGALRIPFLNDWQTKEGDGVYTFSKQGEAGPATIRISHQEISLSSEGELSELTSQYPDYVVYKKTSNSIGVGADTYILAKESQMDERVEGQAVTSLKSGELIIFDYSYPIGSADFSSEIKKAMHYSYYGRDW
ncbi:hypothetical protein JMK10_20465 [Rhodovulum sulfidophilum]|uniref:hypothetical protein n=1 Tax=Rhodovulum sulfidophilum TaxID=35806 RepID=UPI00192414CF|nr:hypothetical protein [Rhodovulum sulfidophilum]MBL3576285.1 hypothetical protein [Rhodovulum sulfidophilum]MCE8433660.1 hypothetical protein [Rhodovulum sulfidophilum]MCF4119064.1 hypothetical protein [Rhodovulum sulfidophilum]